MDQFCVSYLQVGLVLLLLALHQSLQVDKVQRKHAALLADGERRVGKAQSGPGRFIMGALG